MAFESFTAALDSAKTNEVKEPSSKADSNVSAFDPDKRIDTRNTIEPNSDNKYNPDARLKIDNEKTDTIDKTEFNKLINNYISELKEASDFPDTISNNTFDVKGIQIVPSEFVKKLREDFNNHKKELIAQWEKANNTEWPTYKEYVFDKNGNVIRKPGDKYDAHHIVPLFLGGKNEVSNITPLHASKHYDHCGIHSSDSSLSKMKKEIGG